MKLSEVELAQIDWIWPHRLAPGMLTVLEGMPGEGKGLITFDAAARVTRGWPFPPDEEALLPQDQRPQVRQPGSVILISSEDSRARTEAPRAIAAGADLDKIICVPLPAHAAEPGEGVACLCNTIEELAARDNVGLIIIDPLEDAIPGLTSCDASTVRSLLRPLIAAVRAINAAIIGVRHLAKSPRASAIARGTGSIAIAAVARFVFLVASRRNPPSGGRGVRLLACSKCNVCEPPPSLAFSIVTVPGITKPARAAGFSDNSHGVQPVDSDNSHGVQPVDSARVDWIGPSDESADDPELFAAPRADSAIARAELFLLERLSPGPVKTENLLAAAALAGLSEATFGVPAQPSA